MEKKSNIEFIPEFKNEFLHPRYWSAWLGIGAIAAAAMIPPAIRDPLLAKLGRLGGRFGNSARRRARINLSIRKKNAKPSSTTCSKPRRRRW